MHLFVNVISDNLSVFSYIPLFSVGRVWGVGLRFNASSQGRGGRVSQSDTAQPEPHIVFALIGYLRLA